MTRYRILLAAGVAMWGGCAAETSPSAETQSPSERRTLTVSEACADQVAGEPIRLVVGAGSLMADVIIGNAGLACDVEASCCVPATSTAALACPSGPVPLQDLEPGRVPAGTECDLFIDSYPASSSSEPDPSPECFETATCRLEGGVALGFFNEDGGFTVESIEHD